MIIINIRNLYKCIFLETLESHLKKLTFENLSFINSLDTIHFIYL